MPYTPVRDIELIEVGSLGKETLSNDSFTNLSLGISGAATIPLSATDVTLTEGPTGQAQHFVLILTGTLTANVNVIVPAESRVYVADNRTTGAFTVTFRPAAGGGVAVDQAARTLIYCDGTTVYPVASGTGGGGGGSGAPTDASYLVGAAHALLSGERVVTNTATIAWDLATAGQAKASIPADGVSYAHIQNVTSSRLLGRFTAGSGDVQEITPGAGLSLDPGTGVLTATATGQPLDATLTALAGLATGANQVPYSTGTDTFAQTPLTAFARTVLDDADAATVRSTIAAQASDATLTALAGVTTAADALPFFTGVDTASTTTLTAFMRSVLDDPDLATAQATLGITGGGGGSADFLGLTDTPNSYAGQAGKSVVVNGTATALDFTTAATGSYDLGLTWSGTLPASQVLMRYPFPRAVDFPAGLTGSQGRAAVAATALTTLDFRKNGTSVGSLQFAAAGTTATFTMASATSFAVGDVLTVHAPASADATLADLGLSLAGTRAVVTGEMGATTWLGLTDTPDAYTGQAGKVVQVNVGATALEFGTVAATYTDEQAQDAVGTILVDTATIDLTYTDATPSITAAIVAGSVNTTQLANDAVTYAKLQNVTDARLLGRSAGSAGDAQEITVGTGLSLAAGALTGTGQPLDATLTALAGLATGANQLPYATGTDTFTQTTLTAAGRALIDDADAAAQRATLSVAENATGSFTVTATGFSGTAPSGTARWARNGTQVTLALPDLTGTSNATTFTLTGMPAGIAAGSVHRQIVVVESGAGLFQYGTVLVNGTALTVQLGAVSAPWTASGVKSLYAAHLSYLM